MNDIVTPVKPRRKHSPETIAKIRAAHLGKVRGPNTAEHNANISASKKGKGRPPLTAQHKANIGNANRGRVCTPEAVAAMLAGKKRAKDRKAEIKRS